MESKPIEITDELERTQKPSKKDIQKAQELAEDVSPLLASLFNAKEKKDDKTENNS